MIIKNGYSNFKLEILEYCDKSNVIAREQFDMDLLSPEYNLNKTAGSRFGSKHSEETKRIMSENQKGEKNPMFGVLGENNPRFGKKHSEETLNKLRAYTPSETTREQISKKLGYLVEVTDTFTNEISVYHSIGKAADALGSSPTTVSRYIKDGKLFQDRYQLVVYPNN